MTWQNHMLYYVWVGDLLTISLASRSHPSTSGIEEAFSKLKTINTRTVSSKSILMGLAGLKELYNHTEEILKMGSTQRVMSSDRYEFMEEMLDSSLMLMDSWIYICSGSRDIIVESGDSRAYLLLLHTLSIFLQLLSSFCHRHSHWV